MIISGEFVFNEKLSNGAGSQSGKRRRCREREDEGSAILVSQVLLQDRITLQKGYPLRCANQSQLDVYVYLLLSSTCSMIPSMDSCLRFIFSLEQNKSSDNIPTPLARYQYTIRTIFDPTAATTGVG